MISFIYLSFTFTSFQSQVLSELQRKDTAFKYRQDLLCMAQCKLEIKCMLILWEVRTQVPCVWVSINSVPAVQSCGCLYVSIPLCCIGLPTYAPDLPHTEHQQTSRRVDTPVHSFHRHFSEVHHLPGLCGDYIRPLPLRSSLLGEGLKAAFHIQKPCGNQRTP